MRCEGPGFSSCGNHDGDPCLEFGPPTPCADGERCDDGACVPEAATCDDVCDQPDVRVCANDGSGFQQCGQYDDDACLELSPVIRCGAAESCQGGDCVAGCTSDCVADSARCTDGTSQSCGNFDADACLEWGPPIACDGAEICDDGRCTPPGECVHACAPAQQRCDGGGVSSCGQHDGDPCLEWGPPSPCGQGEMCADPGQCISDCEDECADGEGVCAGGGARTCGQFDADPCFELGEAVPCADGETCSDGACSAECVDECDDGAITCAPGGVGVKRCGQFDADPCRDWSSATPCAAHEICKAGSVPGRLSGPLRGRRTALPR